MTHKVATHVPHVVALRVVVTVVALAVLGWVTMTVNARQPDFGCRKPL